MTNIAVPIPPDTQRLLDAKSNALLTSLVSATPAEVIAYMNTSVTTIAQARTVLVALALGLRYVYLMEKK